METRANYVLIGLFTLAGMLGILGFFLWFARVELDRQFAYYDVAFTSVSGLTNASDVRFAGLPVGQVAEVRLSPDRDGTILVRLEIDANTPVRTNSVATIESQGVTGVAFVGIDAGTPDAPLLAEFSDLDPPRIIPGRSALQSLTEDGPQLIAEALELVTSVGSLFTRDNQNRMENILINVEAASEDFSDTLQSFSNVTDSVSGFADQIDRFNDTLEQLSGDMSIVLQSADTTLIAITDAAQQGKRFLDDGADTLVAAENTLTSADTYISDDLPALTEEFRLTITDLGQQVAQLRADASRTLEIFNDTGITATARLVEAEGVLAETSVMIDQLELTLEEMSLAAENFDTLVTDEGYPMMDEAREMIADAAVAVNAIIAATEDDLPTIVSDVRTMTNSAARTIEQIGSDLTSATGKLDGLADSAQITLTTVADTFADANVTLGAINRALDVSQGALEAAERAFIGADKVMNEDIAVITGDLRGAISRLNGVIDQVSDDIPAVTADLRAASTSAQSLFAQLESVVATSGPAVNSFAREGLPLYARLARETRTLISNLDRLTNQISRDPARFLLNQDAPEFRR